MKSAISRAPITASTGLSDSAQIVRGGSNLTTVGAVPYLSASGILNQDASNFFWDATNHRLGIGTNAPAAPLTVRASGATNTLRVEDAGGSLVGNIGQFGDFSATTIKVNSNKSAINASGQLSAYGASIYDATASTGATTLTVKAGAGQSSTGLVSFQNNSGTENGFVSGTGNEASFGYSSASGVALGNNFVGVQIGNTGIYGFRSGAPNAGSLDASLSRIAANVIGVGTGAAGSVAGTLQAATLQALGNGSASNPMLLGSGTWFTSTGTSTTTKPYLLIEPSGTTSTGWSTSGTGLGVNAASGFAGRLADFQVAGVSQAYINNDGSVFATQFSSTAHLVAGAAGSIYWTGRSVLTSPANGNIRLTNQAGTDFGLAQFGGTTSSFPALKRSTTGLIARLADDSADTWVQASQFRSTLTTPASAAATGVAGTIVADANYIYVCTATDTWKRVAIATW